MAILTSNSGTVSTQSHSSPNPRCSFFEGVVPRALPNRQNFFTLHSNTNSLSFPRNPISGSKGATLHAAFILVVALPLHINAYLVAEGIVWQTCMLSILYANFFSYLLLYYTKRLPFGWPRLLLAYRCLSLFFYMFCIFAITVNLIWMFSSIAFDADHVIKVFTLVASTAAYLYSMASATKRMAAIQHQQTTSSSRLDTLQSSLAKAALAKVAHTPAGVDPIEHLLQTQVRPAVEPYLRTYGLTWDDASPALASVDSIDELGMALVNPTAFFERLESSNSTSAKRLLRARLKVVLEPLLAEQSVQWSAVQPSIELMDSVEELRDAMRDPRAFVQKLVATSSASFMKAWLLNQLKQVLEPYVARAGLAWEKAVAVIELIDTVEEVREALADPETFLEKVKQTINNGQLMAAEGALSSAHEAAQTAAGVGSTAMAVGKTVIAFGSKAAVVMNKLQLTRRECVRIFLIGGVILALAVAFTFLGSYLWNSSGNDILSTMAMPFSVLGTKLYSDRKLHKASRGYEGGDEESEDDENGEEDGRAVHISKSSVRLPTISV